LEYQSQQPPVVGLMQVWPSAATPVCFPGSTVTNRDIAALRSAYVRSSRLGMPAPVVHRWHGPEGD
jgi:hypothetical protein